MLQINKVSMLVVCDYMCCCWLIYKSTVRGFILLSFAFSIHSFLISPPLSSNGAEYPWMLHLNTNAINMLLFVSVLHEIMSFT